MYIFDSLGYVNKLKEAGVSEKEAIIHAEALVGVLSILHDRQKRRAYQQQRRAK